MFRVELRGGGHVVLPRITMSSGVKIALYDPQDMGLAKPVLSVVSPYVKSLVRDGYQVIVVPATKPIPLAWHLAYETGACLVVLKKEKKPYHGKTRTFTAKSITSDKVNTFFITEWDYNLLINRKVIFFDDVLSSGATYRAAKRFLKQSCKVKDVKAVFVFKEGNAYKANSDVVYFGNLPLELKDDKDFRKRSQEETSSK